MVRKSVPVAAVSVGARVASVVAVVVAMGAEYAYDPAEPVRERRLQV